VVRSDSPRHLGPALLGSARTLQFGGYGRVMSIARISMAASTSARNRFAASRQLC